MKKDVVYKLQYRIKILLLNIYLKSNIYYYMVNKLYKIDPARVKETI